MSDTAVITDGIIKELCQRMLLDTGQKAIGHPAIRLLHSQLPKSANNSVLTRYGGRILDTSGLTVIDREPPFKHRGKHRAFQCLVSPRMSGTELGLRVNGGLVDSDYDPRPHWLAGCRSGNTQHYHFEGLTDRQWSIGDPGLVDGMYDCLLADYLNWMKRTDE